MKNWLIGKDPDAGKDWRQQEKGMKMKWQRMKWLDGITDLMDMSNQKQLSDWTELISKMDNQQGSTVQHMELCSMLCGSLDERRVWGKMDTCIYTAESLSWSSEAITALLISYTPTKKKNNNKYK